MTKSVFGVIALTFCDLTAATGASQAGAKFSDTLA